MTREEYIQELSDVTYEEISHCLQSAFNLKNGYRLKEVVCAMVSPDEDYDGDDDVPEGSLRIKRLHEKSLDLNVSPIQGVLDFIQDAENLIMCNPNLGEKTGIVVVELEYDIPGGRVHFFRTDARKFMKAIEVTKEGMMLRQLKSIIDSLRNDDDDINLN